LVLIVLSAFVVSAWRPSVAAATTPTVSIVPGPSSGMFSSGQTVTVSVGPNSLFVPHSRVNIIECADPGGTKEGLPTSLSTCDANTIEADTVLVQANGSFKEASYTLYALPNATLGEQANWQPVCNRTDECVLYVGEDQDDFTQPKVFSEPFAFTASAPTIGGGGKATATTVPAPTSSPAVAAGVSLAPSTLAFTGSSSGTIWLTFGGVTLVGAGLTGRRVIRRRWSR
jgi:hypothetical protein